MSCSKIQKNSPRIHLGSKILLSMFSVIPIRQVQAHIFFVLVGYILLMLVRHLVPFDDDPLRIDLKVIQTKVLFVKAVFQEKGCRLNVHFTPRDWLFYYEEEITLN